MTVTEDARAIAIWQKLQEAQTRLNEATKIFSYMFEDDRDINPTPPSCAWGEKPNKDGLYPGQKEDPELKIQTEDDEECLE